LSLFGNRRSKSERGSRERSEGGEANWQWVDRLSALRGRRAISLIGATLIEPLTLGLQPRGLDRPGATPKDGARVSDWPENHDRPRPLSWLRRRLPLETETCWLLLLGVLDLVVTVALLNTGAAREANPLAEWFLATGGVRGLVIFKCAALAVVGVAAQLIAGRHPRVARGVLHLGILAQLVVITYGVWLLGRVLG
jgi:hypothetical protein